MYQNKLVLLLLLLVSCVPKPKPILPIPENGKDYVKRVMVACNAHLSDARKEILAEQISAVGETYFPEESDRRWYYFLICIESKFQTEAKSPVGAIGLTQIMPRFANDFAKSCNLGTLDPKDLGDSQVNLMVGACHFRELMDYYKKDPTLALAAYNSGLDSSTVKKAASADIRNGQPETIAYLASAFILEHRMN